MSKHSEVAYSFVRGVKDTGSRMYTDGERVFSYGSHFVIAKHKSWGYIFNANSYSSSTAKHKGFVMNAISGKVIELIDCDESKTEKTYEQNLLQIKSLKGLKDRARTKKDHYKQEIDYLKDQNQLIKERYLKDLIVEKLTE